MIDIAVMVEPRLHNNLKPVIDNMLKNLNEKTPIKIYHSNLNEDFLKNTYNNNNRIILAKLSRLKNENLTIVEYNMLLTNIDFWNSIDGENVLIFQTDSCLCQHVDNFNLEQFKDYGFIGAFVRGTWLNGGFSLRKKSLTLQCLKRLRPNQKVEINEDKFYTVNCKNIMKPAPEKVAMNFSMEKYYNSTFVGPLGIHKTWIYITKDEWDEFKNRFPEVGLVFKF